MILMLSPFLLLRLIRGIEQAIAGIVRSVAGEFGRRSTKGHNLQISEVIQAFVNDSISLD